MLAIAMLYLVVALSLVDLVDRSTQTGWQTLKVTTLTALAMVAASQTWLDRQRIGHDRVAWTFAMLVPFAPFTALNV